MQYYKNLFDMKMAMSPFRCSDENQNFFSSKSPVALRNDFRESDPTNYNDLSFGQNQSNVYNQPQNYYNLSATFLQNGSQDSCFH